MTELIRLHLWRVFALGFGLWLGAGCIQLIIEGQHVAGAWLLLIPAAVACYAAVFGRIDPY